MARIYANLIEKKIKTIDQIPKKYKEATKIRDSILLEINKLTAEKTINNKFFLEVKSNVFPGTCLKTQETDFKILDKEKGPLKIIFKDNLNFIMEKYNE